MGATGNAGLNAKVQRNLWLDIVTKQYKSLQKLRASLQLSVSEMLTRVNYHRAYTLAMADPRYGGMILERWQWASSTKKQ